MMPSQFISQLIRIGIFIRFQVNKTMKKSNPRLRFRLTSNFANHEKSAVSSLGLVEGNSTITVNTVGDFTDESSTDKKGIDIITTTFNDTAKEVSSCKVTLRIFTTSTHLKFTNVRAYSEAPSCISLVWIFVPSRSKSLNFL